jgi:hypothetical protein
MTPGGKCLAKGKPKIGKAGFSRPYGHANLVATTLVAAQLPCEDLSDESA